MAKWLIDELPMSPSILSGKDWSLIGEAAAFHFFYYVKSQILTYNIFAQGRSQVFLRTGDSEKNLKRSFKFFLQYDVAKCI